MCFFEGGVHLASNCLSCKILPWDSSQSVITHVTNTPSCFARIFGPMGEPSFLDSGGLVARIGPEILRLKLLEHENIAQAILVEGAVVVWQIAKKKHQSHGPGGDF